MPPNPPVDNIGSNIPYKSEHITTGSTGEIVRQYYKDGSTRILKTAVDPSSDVKIATEYNALLRGQDLHMIPKVFDYFPPNDVGRSNRAAYSMEDLSQFYPLNTLSLGESILQRISVDHKVYFILFPLVKTLSIMNQKGISHGDVTLQNIMTTNPLDLRLVDWGNAQDISPYYQVRDVRAVQELIPQIFLTEESTPALLREWAKKEFTSHTDAWDDIFSILNKLTDSKEINKYEKMWKVVQ